MKSREEMKSSKFKLQSERRVTHTRKHLQTVNTIKMGFFKIFFPIKPSPTA